MGTCTHRQRISKRIMSPSCFCVFVIDETSQHMSSKEGEEDFEELYCTVLYHHFGIYKGLPKAAGSWVAREKGEGKRRNIGFLRFPLHIGEAGHF